MRRGVITVLLCTDVVVTAQSVRVRSTFRTQSRATQRSIASRTPFPSADGDWHLRAACSFAALSRKARL